MGVVKSALSLLQFAMRLVLIALGAIVLVAWLIARYFFRLVSQTARIFAP